MSAEREPLYFLSPEERQHRIKKAERPGPRPPSKLDKQAWFAWWRAKFNRNEYVTVGHMTKIEEYTYNALELSKRVTKDALKELNLKRSDPVAKAMLAAIDAADKAAVELQKREGGAR